MGLVLWAIIAVSLILWLRGPIGGYGGWLVWLLLLAAAVVLIIQLVMRRRAV